MPVDLKKIKLLLRQRSARSEDSPLWPTRDDFSYLLKFFGRHKKITVRALMFLACQGVFEVILVLLSHRYLKNGGDIYGLMNNGRVFIFIFIVSVVYLGTSYYAIKLERTLIIKIINNLRLKWFKLSLNLHPEKATLDGKGLLLAKISYHLPLLSIGLTNSLAGAIRWLLYSLILLFLCFVFSARLLFFFVGGIVINLLIAWLAYYISRHYVTRETTFYSKIIKLVDFSLSDWQFTKLFHREKAAINDFNELVELDSYFRVRRDIWLRYGASIVFVLIVFLGWLFSVFDTELANFISKTDANDKFVLIIFTVYFSRLLYESLRTGLYFFPFMLGLSLSVPKTTILEANLDRPANFSELTFKSTKTKLFKKSRYYKNLNFVFASGGRYLISGVRGSGKTALAKFFCGQSEYGRRAWILKVKEKRFFYNDFFARYAGFYFIDPHFKSERSLLEVVAGKEKKRITQEEFAVISTLINKYQELKEIFSEREDWRFQASHFTVNAKNSLLLQVAYCLKNKPFLIAVDNYFLDLNDPDCDALLRLLAIALPQSILIYFAGEKKSLLAFDKDYEI